MFKNVYTTQMKSNAEVLKRRFKCIKAEPVRFKKIFALVCTIIVVLTVSLSTFVMAELEAPGKYTLDIMHNGTILEFENKLFIENGEVYLPLAEFFEKTGMMEDAFASLKTKGNVILLTLCEKCNKTLQNVDASYVTYTYKLIIGEKVLIINPEEIVPEHTSDKAKEVSEQMNNAPILRDEVIYIPYSYAEGMLERAKNTYLSSPEKYNVSIIYSGEMLSVIYPSERYYGISATYGERIHPITGEKKVHNGIDFEVDSGSAVFAGISGTITQMDYDAEKGNFIAITGENGVEITYMHLSAIFPGHSIGDRVNQGAIVGYAGSTGMSTGPHLHMEMRINGEYVNPQLYLTENNYDKLILMLKTDIPNVLAEGGYPDTGYTITDIDSVGNVFTIVKVELENYDNKIVSIMYNYYENTPHEWVGYVLPESYNDFNF